MSIKKILGLIFSLLFILSFKIEASLDYKPINVKAEISEDDLELIKVNWNNPDNVKNDVLNGVISNVKLSIDYKIDNGKFLSELKLSPITADYNSQGIVFNPFSDIKNANAFNSKIEMRIYYTYFKKGVFYKSKSIDTVSLGHESHVHGGKHWSKNDIQLAIGLNIIPESAKEDISAPTTRIEFIKILMGLDNHIARHEVNAVYSFNDCSDPDVTKAYNLGIIEGESNSLFLPNNNITREEMSTIIYRYLVLIGKINGIEVKTSKLLDFNNVSSWAKKSVLNLLSLGIIKGDENSMLQPKQNVTREQAIVIITRILDI